MNFKPILHSLSVTAFALTMLTATASAVTITYETDGPGTGFNGSSNLSLLNTSGASATLAFIPNALSISGIPSNINYGDFTLSCTGCSTQAIGTGATFAPFTFTVQVNDQTDGATGNFVGTSTGGEVFSDTSSILLFWSPLQLGPGTAGAASGSFASTSFRIVSFTSIVAPNSGTPAGQSTVNGIVNASSDVPEPATLGMVGAVLTGLGLWRRRKTAIR
jgi:hypothetical protein